MSVFDFAGIPLISGFKLQASSPLDGRLVVETLSERNELIEKNGAYEGMQVYVKFEDEEKTIPCKKTYVLKDLVSKAWEILGASSGSSIPSEEIEYSFNIPVVTMGPGQTIDTGGSSVSYSQLYYMIEAKAKGKHIILTEDLTITPDEEQELLPSFPCSSINLDGHTLTLEGTGYCLYSITFNLYNGFISASQNYLMVATELIKNITFVNSISLFVQASEVERVRIEYCSNIDSLDLYDGPIFVRGCNINYITIGNNVGCQCFITENVITWGYSISNQTDPNNVVIANNIIEGRSTSVAYVEE